MQLTEETAAELRDALMLHKPKRHPLRSSVIVVILAMSVVTTVRAAPAVAALNHSRTEMVKARDDADAARVTAVHAQADAEAKARADEDVRLRRMQHCFNLEVSALLGGSKTVDSGCNP